MEITETFATFVRLVASKQCADGSPAFRRLAGEKFMKNKVVIFTYIYLYLVILPALPGSTGGTFNRKYSDLLDLSRSPDFLGKRIPKERRSGCLSRHSAATADGLTLD